MKRLTSSLIVRTTLFILCATLLIWSIFSAVLIWQTSQLSRELLVRQHEQFINMLWENLGDEDDLDGEHEQRRDSPHDLQFAIYDVATGRLLNASHGIVLPQQMAGQSRARTVEIADKDWLVSSREDDDVQLIVATPTSTTDAMSHEISERIGWIALIGLLLLFPALYWALRRGLKPIGAFAEHVAARALDNLTPIHTDTATELTPLRERLNELLAQVEQGIAREQRFTADAAHELRTPLAAIQVQLELAQDSPRAEIREKAIGHAHTSVEQATHLLTQLLLLARLDHGQTAEPPERVSLYEVAKEALINAGLAHDETHLPINHSTMLGHAALLKVLFRNLIDNALRYGGANVAVWIDINDNGFVLYDNGLGATADTRQRLGERFYRPLGQTAHGAGLGWSIIKRIAELHHAQLTPFDVTPHGFGVRFTLKKEIQ